MTPVEDIPNWPKLRKTHFVQLLYHLEVRDREEWYYGNRKHFEKRDEELKEWVRSIIRMFDR